MGDTRATQLRVPSAHPRAVDDHVRAVTVRRDGPTGQPTMSPDERTPVPELHHRRRRVPRWPGCAPPRRSAAEGHTGTVVIVGDEPHPPYDRPPLSKQFLAGTWDSTAASTTTAGQARRARARVPPRTAGCRHSTPRAHAVDSTTGARSTTTAWSRHRRPGPALARHRGHGRACTRCGRSRTAMAIRADRAAAAEGARVVVVGAGFIGSEVAATCRGLGATVTVVEALPDPPRPGARRPRWAAACGASAPSITGSTLRTGVGVRALRPEAGRWRRRRSWTSPTAPARRRRGGRGDRRRARPPTGSRARGSTIDDGVVADATLFAADRGGGRRGRGPVVRPGAWARHVRVEHWTNAAEQGVAAARNLLAGSAAAVAPTSPCRSSGPTSTTTKIQVIGLPGPDDEVVVVDGSVGERQAGGPLPAGRPAPRRAGLQPAPPAHGLPPAAGRRCDRSTRRWPSPAA